MQSDLQTLPPRLRGRNESLTQLHQYYAVWQETNNIYEDWAKSHGISYNTLLVLYSLWDSRLGVSQFIICRHWTLPKQTVHSVVKNLERQGYAELLDPISDHRKRRIRLTRTGRAFAENIIPPLIESEIAAMEQLGHERCSMLIESTSMFSRYLRESMTEKTDGDFDPHE